MASLKEIKGRIASVRSTLKITSAMKMVASAKLHKAQMAIEGMLPYQKQLQSVLSELLSSSSAAPVLRPSAVEEPSKRVAIVPFSSNSSLCGAFNANVIRETSKRVDALRAEGYEVEFFPVGRKIAEAGRKMGFADFKDCSSLLEKSSYESASEFAASLVEDWESGRFERVELIYNHFVSTGVQRVVSETYLPFDFSAGAAERGRDGMFIVEPSREEVLAELLSKVVRLKIYTVLLDTLAAEHAARTVAMQTASDNAENILQELTLEYNKSRQQKITAEILDLVGGAQ